MSASPLRTRCADWGSMAKLKHKSNQGSGYWMAMAAVDTEMAGAPAKGQ
jgi:hypothetical protein